MNTVNTKTRSQTTTYDEGLRQHFRSVYNVMSIGLVLTALAAYLFSSSQAWVNFYAGLLSNGFIAMAIMILPFIALSILLKPSAVQSKSVGQLRTIFYGFSIFFGIVLSLIPVAYPGADIARAFFITAATFAGMSVYGYITKSDLSRMGSFLMMGAMGLFLAIIVNVFLQSTMLQFIISCVGVVIYTLMTAYDTQNIKESYSASYGDEANGKMAVMGALSLYINFIMLFQFILSLLNNR
jgi:FtsH-binding integral membrane protein